MMHVEIDDIQFAYYNLAEDILRKDMSDIAFDSDDVVEHLNVFFKSLKEVGQDYYVYDLDEDKVKSLCPSAKTKALKHTERVFAYELYHQWSCLLKGTDWKINAELRKNIEWFYSEDDGTSLSENTSNNNDSSNDFPDMVLHKSQKDNAQLIVCEIKRENRINYDIVKDLNRIYKFTLKKDKTNKEEKDYYQSFKCGVFLVINANFSKIIEAIRTNYSNFVFKVVDNDRLNHIICVSSLFNDNTKEPNICYQSLGEIIRQLNKIGRVEKKCEPTYIE